MHIHLHIYIYIERERERLFSVSAPAVLTNKVESSSGSNSSSSSSSSSIHISLFYYCNYLYYHNYYLYDHRSYHYYYYYCAHEQSRDRRVERDTGSHAVHPVSITRFPLRRLSPGAGLLRYVCTNGFLSNADPGESLVRGNLVMETGCIYVYMHYIRICVLYVRPIFKLRIYNSGV